MLTYILSPKLKLDQIKEGGGGGGETPPAAAPKPSEQQPPVAASVPAPAAEGDTLDEFGYEKEPKAATPVTPPPGTAPEKSTPPATPAAAPAKAASGYGTDLDKADEPVTPPAAPVVAEPVSPTPELDKALEGLPKEELTKIKDFATKHKLTPDVAKAYAELRKGELVEEQKQRAGQVQAAEQEIKQRRRDWQQELKTDPTFGGANFEKNLANVDKVLNDFMPNTKKVLTEHGSVLPPYFMRDLAKLAETVYKTETLVSGGPTVPKVDEAGEEDPLAWYNQPGGN